MTSALKNVFKEHGIAAFSRADRSGKRHYCRNQHNKRLTGQNGKIIRFRKTEAEINNIGYRKVRGKLYNGVKDHFQQQQGFSAYKAEIAVVFFYYIGYDSN